eukprot:TRINITY_DN11359_c0_g1_i2.p1 TRINITY_DN11359_c0_g1~~TRINITY_DN11359_c0_g1_i2.p1  ORF type:complete len:308 (-),score=32.03 TRINITY_DN11359_c0_g1_i2:221-1144(-)
MAGFATDNPLHLFLVGGLSSCCGELVTLPVDMVKVRQQVYGTSIGEHTVTHAPSLFSIAYRVIRDTGFFSLWQGVVPALLRQFLYCGLRLATYEPIKDFISGGRVDTYHEKSVPVYQKILAAALAGSISSALCTPTDVIKTRMQATNHFGQKYRSTLSAFRCILKNEGFFGLYKAWGPTSCRAAVVGCSELISYDEAKHYLFNMGYDGVGLHLGASLISGLVATFFSAPVDFLKTRLQSQPLGQNGKGLIYRHTLDCAFKSVKHEGLLVLWRGVTAHYLRKGPHLVVSFICLEQFRTLANKWEGRKN